MLLTAGKTSARDAASAFGVSICSDQSDRAACCFSKRRDTYPKVKDDESIA